MKFTARDTQGSVLVRLRELISDREALGFERLT